MGTYIHRVHYYETDQMGIAHHSNYIRWMEEARVDFFDRIGLSYKEMEETGLFSPVVRVECDFRAPTAFEDAVEIRVSVDEFKGVRLFLRYEMTKSGSGETVSTGRSVHCFVDREGRLVVLKRAFPELDAKLKSLLADVPDGNQGEPLSREGDYRI